MTDIKPAQTKEQIQAEIGKFEAETLKAKAEAEQALAVARFNLASARKAEAEAVAAEILLVKAHEQELQRTKSDEHHHVYQFDGAVTDASVNRCMTHLRTWDRIDPECPIELILNSPGGAVIPGMALFDLLVRFSTRGGGRHHVTVGSQGFAASMAGILLQAGDTRWIGAQSFLMIHEISAGTGGKIGEMMDAVKFYDAICARIVDIFVARSEGKITKKKFIDSWTRADWWLLSNESLKLGFVDEIR